MPGVQNPHWSPWLVAGREPLDGQHLGAVDLTDEKGAGLDRAPIDMNDAGAAL